MWKEKTSYISFGSEADDGTLTPITLTTSYSDNIVTHFCKYLDNLSFDGKYTAAAGVGDKYLYINVEVSNDEGKNWVPILNKEIKTDQTDLYVFDKDGNQGSPNMVPGTLNGVGNGIYPFNLQYGPFQADFVRISVKENSGGGTLFLRTSFTNNQ